MYQRQAIKKYQSKLTSYQLSTFRKNYKSQSYTYLSSYTNTWRHDSTGLVQAITTGRHIKDSLQPERVLHHEFYFPRFH